MHLVCTYKKHMFTCKIRVNMYSAIRTVRYGPISHCSSLYIFNGATPELYDKYYDLGMWLACPHTTGALTVLKEGLFLCCEAVLEPVQEGAGDPPLQPHPLAVGDSVPRQLSQPPISRVIQNVVHLQNRKNGIVGLLVKT